MVELGNAGWDSRVVFADLSLEIEAAAFARAAKEIFEIASWGFSCGGSERVGLRGGRYDRYLF